MGSDNPNIETPSVELDIPPSSSSVTKTDDLLDLTPAERRDWQKWLKNLDFIKYVISFMFILYLSDIATSILAPSAEISLHEPLFEALKILLFTASGYVFAKSSDK